jgi:filamentous hemagglutinin
VDNRSGEISSAQAFTLAADSPDNSNGNLIGNQAVTLRVQQALTQSQRSDRCGQRRRTGQVPEQQRRHLYQSGRRRPQVNGQLDNQDQGLINAAHNLSTAAGLNNQSGGSFWAAR